ncbi:unnamed protein product [Thlaspi arvense]|uniref:Uncharacterized protein n=1 Tax=Thlaspi arvense TaxID=13288 RepID=A0AAU9RSB7_THLAR|nr:unnamed protein product [Thlaspi arvense]
MVEVKPDRITLIAVLSACASTGALDIGNLMPYFIRKLVKIGDLGDFRVKKIDNIIEVWRNDACEHNWPCKEAEQIEVTHPFREDDNEFNEPLDGYSGNESRIDEVQSGNESLQYS